MITGTIPLVPSLGETVKVNPLQTTEVIAVTTGVGYTVTVRVKLLVFPQPTEPGVTV